MCVVCNLMVGVAGEEGVGEWGRWLKGEDAKSRGIFETSAVGDNKDNLAKWVDGEETDAEGAGTDVFFDLQRGGTGGGGMMAESGVQ